MHRYRLAGLLALAAFTALFWTALLAAVLWLTNSSFDVRVIATVALSITGIVLLFGAPLFTECEPDRPERQRDDDGPN